VVETIEFAVVGAGVHGVSAAYHLARRGLRPHLFDRGAVAGGPTGRSSAICRAHYTNPFLAAVARESIDLFAQAGTWLGEPGAYRQTGVLFLHPQSDLAQVERTVPMLREVGTDALLLDRQEIADRWPALRLDDIAAGVYEPRAGCADPVLTTTALHRRAVEMGVVSHLHTEVLRLTPLSRGGAVLETSDGEVACERVVVAAGPWTCSLLEPAGIHLPLHAERHVVATFAWPSDMSLDVCIADLPGGYYLRPEGSSLFSVGPLDPSPACNPDDVLNGIADDEVLSLGAALARRAPVLESAGLQGGWASLYDVSPDWQPVIGEVAPGIVVDAGTSGHGFKLAPALGRHVAALLCGEAVPGLEQFHPDRFATGATLSAGYGSARILG
jgi:glycine/D-amino acid oxidase-like deaminating enzyme